MSMDKGSDEDIRDGIEAWHGDPACQEEIYLEDIEERARAILIAEQPFPSDLCRDRGPLEAEKAMAAAAGASGTIDSVDEQLKRAAEELITGDYDDPPLSDDAVEKMLRRV